MIGTRCSNQQRLLTTRQTPNTSKWFQLPKTMQLNKGHRNTQSMVDRSNPWRVCVELWLFVHFSSRSNLLSLWLSNDTQICFSHVHIRQHLIFHLRVMNLDLLVWSCHGMLRMQYREWPIFQNLNKSCWFCLWRNCNHVLHESLNYTHLQI